MKGVAKFCKTEQQQQQTHTFNRESKRTKRSKTAKVRFSSILTNWIKRSFVPGCCRGEFIYRLNRILDRLELTQRVCRGFLAFQSKHLTNAQNAERRVIPRHDLASVPSPAQIFSERTKEISTNDFSRHCQLFRRSRRTRLDEREAGA